MGRPVTLFTGQWADLEFRELCKTVKEMGYDGVELCTWGDHMELQKAVSDPDYIPGKKKILDEYGLICKAVGAHLPGQCTTDLWDDRLNGFAPQATHNDPEAIRAWGVEEMKLAAKAASAMGAPVVTGFMGSPIWKFWYSFPQTTEKQIEEGFQQVREIWDPILDVYEEEGVKFALEVHPTEIAFDYWSAVRLFEVFADRKSIGINFDPSHLIWQGIKPEVLIRDLPERIFHVHMKDAAVTLDGRNGILGSHLPFGDYRRGWNFRSLGHGDVKFEEIIRALNDIGYNGPLSVEWEDNGMDRIAGGTEASEFVRKVDFAPSAIEFDKAMETD